MSFDSSGAQNGPYMHSVSPLSNYDVHDPENAALSSHSHAFSFPQNGLHRSASHLDSPPLNYKFLQTGGLHDFNLPPTPSAGSAAAAAGDATFDDEMRSNVEFSRNAGHKRRRHSDEHGAAAAASQRFPSPQHTHHDAARPLAELV